MEIFLTKQCKSLTGSVGQGFGYHIQRRGDHFYGVRQSKGHVPPLGHLRFIITCAQMAQMALHITDIAVPRQEFIDALWEAGMRQYADHYTLHPEELAPCTSRASLREPQKQTLHPEELAPCTSRASLREPQKKTLNARQVLDLVDKFKLGEVLK